MPKRNSPIQQIKKIVLQYFWVIFKTTCFSVNNRLYLRIGSRNTTDNTRYSKYREKRYFPYPIVIGYVKKPNNMNEQVTKYISEAPEEQKKIMEKIRTIIHQEVPSVMENFKWSRPVFSTDTDFAYFKSAKAYLSFGVFKYDKIKEDAHLLEGTGKDMRHIKIKKLDDLRPEVIKKWIQQITE